MINDTLLLVVASWLATYIVHSTVLLGLTAVATLRIRAEAWRDTLWKVALVGGVVSATAQVALDMRPLGGRVSVTMRSAPAVEPAAPAEVSASPSASTSASPTTSPSTRPSASQTPPPALPDNRTPAPASPDAVTTDGYGNSIVARSALGSMLLVWAAIAFLLLLRLAYRHVQLFRMLGDRRQVVEGGLADVLAELRRNAGIWRPVWLAASSHCPTPLALGASEICVPERFVTELQRDEQRAALAHELAHIARRDPLWHLVAGIIESVLFFQPLNRLARLRMREAAEHLCDDWAVDRVGSEIGLARCLAAVASWVGPGRNPVPSGTMAMAEGGSPLLVRVQRLLERRDRSGVVPFASRALASAAVLTVLVVSAPAIVTAALPRNEQPRFVALEGPRDTALPKPPAGTASPEREAPTRASSERLTAPASAPVESLTVIRVSRGGTLHQQWDRARDDARRREHNRYWVAWAIPTVVPRGESIVSDSRGWSVSDFSRPAIADQLNVNDEVDAIRDSGQPVIVMLQLFIPENGITQITGVSVRSASAGMRLDRPIYWLGAQRAEESMEFLSDFARTVGERNRLGETMVTAVAVHRNPGVVKFLVDLIDDPRAEHLHLRAIEGLRWHPSDENLARLVNLARENPHPFMQRNAVEAIGRMNHPRASEELRSLVRQAREPVVRREVMEALGERPDARTLEVLVTAAETDADVSVRRQAAEALGKLPAKQALEGLGRIIWNSNDPSVQVEAVEALGDVATRDALALLMRVIEKHDNDYVVVEAVETVGSLPSAWASPVLVEVSRRHPLEAARAKAMEELGDLSRRKADDRDVNPNPNYDGGNPDPGNFKSSKGAAKGAAQPDTSAIHR